MSLSHRSYYFLGAIALLGILGQWVGAELYHLWRFPAALIILSAIYEAFYFRRQSFSIHYYISKRIELGRVCEFTVELRNLSASPLLIEAQILLPEVLLGDDEIQLWKVGANSSGTKMFKIRPIALGSYDLGVCYTRTLGCLGLVWWSRKIVSHNKVTVVPQLFANEKFIEGSDTLGERDLKLQNMAGIGTDLLSLREYRAGDPMRAIDWKASARVQKPIVRIHSDEQHIELMVLLDIGRSSLLQAGSLTRLNHYINITARLAEMATQSGDKVGLISYADRVVRTTPLAGNMQGLLNIRQHLQNLRHQTAESNPLSAVLHLNTMLKHRGVVVFFTEIAEAEAASQLIKSISLLVPKHIPIIASIKDKLIEEMRHKVARHWLDPYRSYAALEYTDAIRHSAMHLRRLGGQVVLEKPEQLNQSLVSLYGRLRERRSI